MEVAQTDQDMVEMNEVPYNPAVQYPEIDDLTVDQLKKEDLPKNLDKCPKCNEELKIVKDLPKCPK